jgi:hypothetical protein
MQFIIAETAGTRQIRGFWRGQTSVNNYVFFGGVAYPQVGRLSQCVNLHPFRYSLHSQHLGRFVRL